MTTYAVTHQLNDALTLAYAGQPLFHYVYNPDTPPNESPKPYFHPIYTLGGNLVTNFRPHDHVWHKGLCMTITHLSGQNFWGGPTYVHGEGYVQQHNNGRMQHAAWETIECTEEGAHFQERLTWITLAGETWVDETRHFAVHDINADAGYWSLDVQIKLTNRAGQPLEIGSPTTQGRPLAGYGGLFWRGPRSFRGGQIVSAVGVEGEGMMGQAAPWLAFRGKHDGNGATSTLAFLDYPQNLRYPNKWFVRSDPFACASFAFMFDEVYNWQAEETLDLHYRIVIADGVLEHAQIDALATSWQTQVSSD